MAKGDKTKTTPAAVKSQAALPKGVPTAQKDVKEPVKKTPQPAVVKAAPKAAAPKPTAPAPKKAAPAKTEETAATSEKKPVTQKLAEKKAAAVNPAEKKPVEKAASPAAPKLELTSKVAPKKGGPSPAAPAAKEAKKPAKAPLRVKTGEEIVKLRKAAQAEQEKEGEEDSSDSNFDFLEQESESVSESVSKSTDLSSSGTDESKKLELALDTQTMETLQKRLEPKKKVEEIKASDPRGIIYLAHLPFGFFEEQMKRFFAQFGVVTRLKLSRNKKTGKSKHYAFVEFLDPFVAQVVADTMDGYFMLHRVLKCKIVPADKVHPRMFHGSKRGMTPIPHRELQKGRVNKALSPDEHAQRVARQLKKEEALRKKIAASGFDYDFPVTAERTGGQKRSAAAIEGAKEADKVGPVKKKAKVAQL